MPDPEREKPDDEAAVDVVEPDSLPGQLEPVIPQLDRIEQSEEEVGVERLRRPV